MVSSLGASAHSRRHATAHSRHSRRHPRGHAGHTRRHHARHSRRARWESRRHARRCAARSRQCSTGFWLHLDGCWASHAPHGSRKTGRSGAQRRGGHSTTGDLPSARTRLNIRLLGTGGWRSLSHQRHDGLASQNYEAKRPLDLLLVILSPFRLDLPELLAISKHHIHVLVESHKCSNQHAGVGNGHADTIIQPLGHPCVSPRHG
mmetsp:Transcript_61894/g.145021  ORF Transcript_61894/g.145021 Transcript_61894/m.145021 type:complete len:205 (-) Transcript_61894:46-660(-)